jgi:hypothetical protein
MSRAQRAARLKKVALVCLSVVLVCGLLLCGPAHVALHELVAGNAHADADGSWCTGCSLHGLESPAPVCLLGPALRPLELTALRPAHVPAAPPLLAHSPRGPPTFAV